MIEITEQEYKQFQVLKKAFTHLNAEMSGAWFICSESGRKLPEMWDLPETIMVCPQYGADTDCVAMYKIVKREVDINDE